MKRLELPTPVDRVKRVPGWHSRLGGLGRERICGHKICGGGKSRKKKQGVKQFLWYLGDVNTSPRCGGRGAVTRKGENWHDIAVEGSLLGGGDGGWVRLAQGKKGELWGRVWGSRRGKRIRAERSHWGVVHYLYLGTRRHEKKLIGGCSGVHPHTWPRRALRE